MNCNKFKNKIIRYTEGRLSENEKMEFERHLEECKECSELFKNVSVTYTSVELRQEIEPKAFFAESVINKLSSPEEEMNREDILFTAFFRKLAITGVAFVFALLMIFYVSEGTFSFNFLSDDETNIEDNTPELIFDNFN